jgi:hypothetical protein
MYMIKKPAEFFFHACNIRFFFAFLLIYYFGCYANGEFNNFLEHEFVSYFIGIYFLHIEKYLKNIDHKIYSLRDNYSIKNENFKSSIPS